MAIWQVTALQRLLGQEIRNIFYYESALTTLDATNLQAVSDAFRTAWGTGLVMGSFTNDWTLYGTTIRRVDTAGLPSVDVGFTSGALVGTLTGENMATQIALLVHGTSYSTKPNRVRTYRGGWGEGILADGLFPAATLTAAVTWAEALHAFIVGGEDFQRQCARWSVDGTVVEAWNEVDAYFAAAVPATQRRRRIGRGS